MGLSEEKTEIELIPVTEADLELAYGCKCVNCSRKSVRPFARCCYKDCYHITTGKWNAMISTSR